jgi:hypothetical protein
MLTGAPHNGFDEHNCIACQWVDGLQSTEITMRHHARRPIIPLMLLTLFGACSRQSGSDSDSIPPPVETAQPEKLNEASDGEAPTQASRQDTSSESGLSHLTDPMAREDADEPVASGTDSVSTEPGRPVPPETRTAVQDSPSAQPDRDALAEDDGTDPSDAANLPVNNDQDGPTTPASSSTKVAKAPNH